MKHGENGHLKKLFVFTSHLCMKGIGEMLFCIVKGGFKLSFYGGLKMYDLGGLGIDRCQAI